MKKVFKDVYDYSKKYDVSLRYGAYALALDRVAEAMRLRGWI